MTAIREVARTFALIGKAEDSSVEIVVLLVILGLIGAVCANAKGSSKFGGFLLGFLLGPIGWLLILLFAGPKRGRCPQCASQIPVVARRCPRCGADLRSEIDKIADEIASGSRAPIADAVVVGESVAQLYREPDLKTWTEFTVSPGVKLAVAAHEGEWTLVVGANAAGWVERRFITETPRVAAASTKTCPQCAETVQAAAKICRFCRYEFEPV